jgi:hypothetical protein
MQTFIGILLGGGFLAFLQFLITRHDNKVDKLGELRKAIADLRADIKRLEEKGDKREAVSVRVRILGFEDELQEGHRHSKDSFDQVLSDVTTYEHYCENHPEFKNNQTAATVDHIKKVYHERLEKRDFNQ